MHINLNMHSLFLLYFLYHFRSGQPSTLIPKSSIGYIALTLAFNMHPQISQTPFLLCSHLLQISRRFLAISEDLPVILL